MHKEIINNLRYLKQSWPYTRRPIIAPDLDTNTPIPPAYNTSRIGKVDTDDVFIEAGIRDITCILNISENYNVPIYKSIRVLDWGVGCGRTIRHLPSHLRNRAIGIDVDPINIKWCKDNIPWAKFYTVFPYGQTPIEESSIDLLYGISVLTHLSEIDQTQWLQEINRIIKGTALLSVHGLYHASHCDWTQVEEYLTVWLRHGFLDADKPNLDIADVTPEGYYRDTAHTTEYIYTNWSKHIEVIDVIPGGISVNHDVVVCRKKA